MQNGTATGKAERSIRLGFLIVNLLFLLSGLSSLIYQVIWTRMLVFVFGSTTFATSTVLAVFMGGLACGSFLAGRLADRVKDPFKWYGILEGVIGVWALLAPLLFAAAVPIYQLFFEPLHLRVIEFGLLRFTVAALILLPPTACMGATLPLLSRFVTSKLSEVGDRVGSLYAINTLGAVAGSIFGGFVLLPSFGISATTYIAAATNLLLALAVFYLSKQPEYANKSLQAGEEKQEASTEAQTGSAAEQSSEAPAKLPTLVKVTMFSFAVSGAIAMIYEVAWTRSLLMVIGSTTYAFTIMLSTFLLGIFLGSWLCARYVDRMKSPILGFAVAQMVLCLVSFFSVATFNFLPYLNVVFGIISGGVPEVSMFFRFVSAGFVMFPIALVLGTIFPIAVKICALDMSRLGRSIGQLYSMNTLGAIIGAFLAGFAVIPFLGSEKTLVYCSIANLFVGILLLICFGEVRNSLKVLSAIAAVAATFLAGSVNFWDYRMIAIGQSQRRPYLNTDKAKVIPSFEEWKEQAVGHLQFPFYKEGKVATVAIHATLDDKSHSLFTNGHGDASDTLDMANQALIAAFPLLIKPDAQDVCVVGWGSGVTAGYALQFPIKQMICSEIEPVVIEASRFFHPVNFVPENDPRTIVEPSDGRNYLLGTKQKFDVIISEPSNPWQTGVCNLFTREYFRICRNSLKPGGVFTMWSQINEIQPKNLAQIFAALHEVFPYVYVFNTDNVDINAVASDKPMKLSYEALKKGFADPKVKSALLRWKLNTPEDFIARVLICPNGIDAAVKDVKPNSDDRNRLEYEVSKTYEDLLFRKENGEWLDKYSTGAWDFVDWGKMSDTEKAKEYVKVAFASTVDPARAIAWAEQSNKLSPNADATALIAQIQIAQRNYPAAGKTIVEGEKLYPEDERFPGLAGVIALRKADYSTARSLLQKAIELKASNNDFRYFLAATYSALDLHEQDADAPRPASDPQKVIELCSLSSQDEKFCKARPNVLLLLASAYNEAQKYTDAERCLKKLLVMQPDNYRVWKLLSECYVPQKKWTEAKYCQTKAFLCAANATNRALALAQSMLSEGKYDLALAQLKEAIKLEPADERTISLLGKLAEKHDKARAFYGSILTDASILKTGN